MKIGVIIFCSLCLLVSASVSPCDIEIIRDPKAWDFAPLIYYDLAVRGTVIDVQVGRVSNADLWMVPPEVAEITKKHYTGVKRVTLEVIEVLRGPDIGDTTVIIVPLFGRDYATSYLRGDEQILCANYHQRLDSYYLKSPYGKYVKKDDQWVCEGTARGTRSFSDSEIRSKVESMSIGSVVSEAELIITGTVTSVEKGEIEGPDGSKASLLTLHMAVQRVLKGSYSEPEISIEMITEGVYLPGWRKHVPDNVHVGQEWMAFLRIRNQGWYPFAGTNGLFRIENDSLIYDERVAYWHGKQEVEEIIAKEVER